MSKLGKKPILVPKDTKIKIEGGKLTLTGLKGSKELSINDKIFRNYKFACIFVYLYWSEPSLGSI